jgi:diadenosine tetraphosphate (Ap4A) HIT family hydrolase
MQEPIFSNPYGYILQHESTIPWVKIFSTNPYKELSDCDPKTREFLFTCMDTCERAMIEFYKPEKINIAIFGNYLPHVHIHVMARFKEDSHFPEPMWGELQRESTLKLPLFEDFLILLKSRLKPLVDFL